ncbi:uncharacterized protein LOC119773804 isoform X2 [Cyprinodon tularosa]|uniref:uncharacterized protein LOC119773804 isoform X2 n=1 Tax=Cyprinodon tularosa TaxID=77115 RepID=UPI0018E1FF6D|nr:uncharacterized protein LOC119773804 isoform X2 [Cyprinodon tularosa]
MELLGMVLVLVLLGSEAQNQENVNVSLGQNVPLTCSINVGDIHWFMEDQNQSRRRIGLIFSQTDPIYDSLDFETKYLMIRNQLVIQNFSAEDSRRYFCGKKENDASGGTFILIPAVPLSTAPPCDCEAERLTFSIYRSAVVLSLLLSLTAGQCGAGHEDVLVFWRWTDSADVLLQLCFVPVGGGGESRGRKLHSSRRSMN